MKLLIKLASPAGLVVDALISNPNGGNTVSNREEGQNITDVTVRVEEDRAIAKFTIVEEPIS